MNLKGYKNDQHALEGLSIDINGHDRTNMFVTSLYASVVVVVLYDYYMTLALKIPR